MPVPDGLHGMSLVPLFFGGAIPERPICVTSRALSDDPTQPVCSTITDGVWTLQYRGPDYPAELHNVESDPAQVHNCYRENHDQAARLHDAHLSLLRQAGTSEAKIALRARLPD